jgi:hypothetical protein
VLGRADVAGLGGKRELVKCSGASNSGLPGKQLGGAELQDVSRPGGVTIGWICIGRPFVRGSSKTMGAGAERRRRLL